MSKKFDTDCTDFPTCPYCGYVERDYWELFDSKSDDLKKIECASCEQEYTCSLTVIYIFSSYQIEKKQGETNGAGQTNASAEETGKGSSQT